MEEEGSITPWDVQSRRIFPEEGKWPSLYSGEGGGHGYVRILRNTNMEHSRSTHSNRVREIAGLP